MFVDCTLFIVFFDPISLDEPDGFWWSFEFLIVDLLFIFCSFSFIDINV